MIRARWLNAPKLLVDCSYENLMSKKYLCYAIAQIMHLHGTNRKDPLPFDVHICNADPNSHSMRELQKRIPNIMDKDCSVVMHRECYSDLYPLKNLVYLSPYSPHILREYNPEDVYVVGAVIDDGRKGPISMTKAKQLGIRTAWLPINYYLDQTHHASKLPINIVIDILREYKNTENWVKAFAHVPQRMRKPLRQEHHMLHKVIDNVLDARDNMPRLSWDDILDQTRAMDDVTADSKYNRFKLVATDAVDAQEATTERPKRTNPFN